MVEIPPDAPLLLYTSVMINFLHINRFPLICNLGWKTVVTHHALVKEVKTEEFRRVVDREIAARSIGLVDEPIPVHILASFIEWERRLGKRDATLLANAVALGATIATDDRAAIKAGKKVGLLQVETTVALLRQCIIQEHITLHQANNSLKTLARNSFDPRIPCFCQLVGVQCRGH